jgi:nucleoside-diphosphate-sugar epimerase
MPPSPLQRFRGVPVLLTGATGFVGRALWEALAHAGARVFAVGRDPVLLARAAAGKPESRIVAADLARPGVLAALHRTTAPAVLFNLAGYGVRPTERDHALSLRINAALPVEAAQAASGSSNGWTGQRLVHVGSAFEYGCVEGTVTEGTDPAPATQYGLHKLEGTRRVAEARAAGARATTARICTVYGPGEHPHRLLPTLLRAAATDETVELTAGEQERDFTFVRDVAEGLMRLALAPGAPPVVNLATGTACTVRAFAEAAMAEAGLEPFRVRFGALPYRPDEVWQGPVDVSLLRRTLDWSPPVGVAEGVRTTCNHVLGGRKVLP